MIKPHYRISVTPDLWWYAICYPLGRPKHDGFVTCAASYDYPTDEHLMKMLKSSPGLGVFGIGLDEAGIINMARLESL